MRTDARSLSRTRSRLVLAAAALAALLSISCSALGSDGSGGNGGGPTPPGAPDMRGYVTNVTPAEPAAGGDRLGTILIDSTATAGGYDRASVTVTGETSMEEARAGAAGGATEQSVFSRIRIGDRVDVWFTGPVLESYPVQATARRVVLYR